MAFASLKNTKAFTLVEVLMASIILSFAAAGIWTVYWSILNTYYVEIRGTQLHADGSRILDLMVNGGYFNGRRIYGLSAMSGVSGSGYPMLGQRSSASPIFVDSDDYRIEFILDDNLGAGSGNTRYAEFSVAFTSPNTPTSNLYFKLRTAGIGGSNNDHNYDVLLTDNMLQRVSNVSDDPDDFRLLYECNRTWFKAEKLPSGPGHSTGVKISFYLIDDMSLGVEDLQFNCRLDRKLKDPRVNPEQDKSFLRGLPYPEYFSTTVFFTCKE